MKKYLKYGIMGVLAVTLSAILFKPQPKEETVQSPRSYEEILHSGVLRAVTEYNSISFHVQSDTLEGLHYELLQDFARDKGLKAEITPEMNLRKRTEGILNGTCIRISLLVLVRNKIFRKHMFVIL